ncbi:GNAT family N-acetyltransferase [Diaphorobacter ruginosibacter]|uniref:GNAT family N-acetyltransferase n=1 Tax=Diaphorobacter ruginosibacter TaxID=1715720 RepID=UPI003340B540
MKNEFHEFIFTPWDSAVFGVPTFEIGELSHDLLLRASKETGHYTIKVDPLTPKELLHEFGFYYCDTLIEPVCEIQSFVSYPNDHVEIRSNVALEDLLSICDGAFQHGRFHRDFNLKSSCADARYNNWLCQLHKSGKVYGLFYEHELSGFIAVENGKLLLHAVSINQRGRGLAKYLWSPVCEMLFNQGINRITSSVSTTNLAVVNLYSRIGFTFRHPLDVYHRMTR